MPWLSLLSYFFGGAFLANVSMNDLELLTVSRLVFFEFCRDIGASEHGDDTLCIALQISPGNGGSNP